MTTAAVLERFTGGPDSGLFTDGSSSGNPGPGGWGVVYVREGEIVAERYGADGWLRRGWRNLTTLALYFLGVAPERLARRYAQSRGRSK